METMNRYNWIFLDLIIVFNIFFCVVAQSAPVINSISGTVSNGNVITISGSGFRSTGPNISIYHDFEKGTNGNLVSTTANSATVNQWSRLDEPTQAPARYSNDYAHSGSLSMRNYWGEGGSAEPGGRLIRLLGNITEVYFQFWMMIPVGGHVPGEGTLGANWKIWNISGDPWPGAVSYESTLMVNVADWPPTSWGFILLNPWYGPGDSLDSSQPGYHDAGYASINLAPSVWHRVEVYMKGGSSSNGTLGSWHMSANQPRAEMGYSTTKTNLPNGAYYQSIRFPAYARGDATSRTYHEDIYVATGAGARARVEIGNAATYSTSTNLAVATSTSWSNTSVQATVRQGSFTNGSAYLYVTDATGVVNANGYPITVGGGGGTTYTVTPSAGANGTISPNTPQTVNSGSTTTFTVTPNSGYSASVGGTCGGNLVGTTYTTNAITGDCTVSATFVVSVPIISSVSGTVSSGNVITISGSSFGSTGPNIILFDDFEKGTNGSIISLVAGSATVNQWSRDGGDPSLTTYTTARAHSGTKSMQNIFDTTIEEPGNRMILDFSASTEVFYSFWTMIPTGRTVPGDGNPSGPNWKISWLSGSGTWPDSDYIYSGESWWWSTSDWSKGQWKRLDGYHKGGQTTGTVTLTELTSSGRIDRISGINTFTLLDGHSWTHMSIPGYGRGNTLNGMTAYDDVYFSIVTGARARVEIGNNSTYSVSTKLAIITPTSWNDTLIQATVRQGSFTNGSAYLYVINANGAVNANGYPITIVSGVKLAAPRNLRIL